jgi:hypothetical protein
LPTGGKTINPSHIAGLAFTRCTVNLLTGPFPPNTIGLGRTARFDAQGVGCWVVCVREIEGGMVGGRGSGGEGRDGSVDDEEELEVVVEWREAEREFGWEGAATEVGAETKGEDAGERRGKETGRWGWMDVARAAEMASSVEEDTMEVENSTVWEGESRSAKERGSADSPRVWEEERLMSSPSSELLVFAARGGWRGEDVFDQGEEEEKELSREEEEEETECVGELDADVKVGRACDGASCGVEVEGAAETAMTGDGGVTMSNEDWDWVDYMRSQQRPSMSVFLRTQSWALNRDARRAYRCFSFLAVQPIALFYFSTFPRLLPNAFDHQHPPLPIPKLPDLPLSSPSPFATLQCISPFERSRPEPNALARPPATLEEELSWEGLDGERKSTLPRYKMLSGKE